MFFRGTLSPRWPWRIWWHTWMRQAATSPRWFTFNSLWATGLQRGGLLLQVAAIFRPGWLLERQARKERVLTMHSSRWCQTGLHIIILVLCLFPMLYQIWIWARWLSIVLCEPGHADQIQEIAHQPGHAPSWKTCNLMDGWYSLLNGPLGWHDVGMSIVGSGARPKDQPLPASFVYDIGGPAR